MVGLYAEKQSELNQTKQKIYRCGKGEHVRVKEEKIGCRERIHCFSKLKIHTPPLSGYSWAFTINSNILN